MEYKEDIIDSHRVCINTDFFFLTYLVYSSTLHSSFCLLILSLWFSGNTHSCFLFGNLIKYGAVFQIDMVECKSQ